MKFCAFMRGGAGLAAALVLCVGGLSACAMDGAEESFVEDAVEARASAMDDLDCMVTLSEETYIDTAERRATPCRGHSYELAYSNNVLASYMKSDIPGVIRVAFAFRGSASVGDWIRNLQSQVDRRDLSAVGEFPLVGSQSDDYAKAKVGAGWDDRWANQAGLVLGLLEQARADYPDRHLQIYFTGHSLGGVMATRAALDVSISNWQFGNTVRTYAWNPPRLGDDEAAKVMQAAIVPCAGETSECFEYRQFTRRRDIVHGLPLNLSFDSIFSNPWSHAVWQRNLERNTGKPLELDIGYCPHFHAPKIKRVNAHNLDTWHQQLADRSVFTEEWVDCMFNP